MTAPDAPGAPAAGVRRSGALAAATREDFSLAAAVGGPRGFAEAVLPGLVFVVVFTITRDLRLCLVIALGAAAVLVLARLVARLPLTPALSGAVGVAVCAWSAHRTGDAADFYTPGFVINAVYAAVLLLSTLPWPRIGPVPLVGVLVGPLTVGREWRADPRRVRVYRRLTWLFAGLFLLRLAVQVPLYLADEVTALGIARLTMGVPLLVLVAWVAWASLRRLDAAAPATGPAAPTAAPTTAGPGGV